MHLIKVEAKLYIILCREPYQKQKNQKTTVLSARRAYEDRWVAKYFLTVGNEIGLEGINISIKGQIWRKK